MLERIEAAPKDAILGLGEAFKADPRSEKINLSVGVYQDENGKTPLLECVKEAERRLAANPTTKSYLPISGLAEYCKAVAELAFGAGSEPLVSKRVAWAQTPGGTGALRVSADFIAGNLPSAVVWMSEPTWPNHPQIFSAAGITTKTYPYFDAKNNSLNLAGMLAGIEKMAPGDVILLHGCCHNPTGIDPTASEWTKIADAVYACGVMPLLDFAYQGFGDGLEEDAVGLKAFCRPGAELMVCSSYSKNFGLYRERVGALFVVTTTAAAAASVQTQIDKVIRSNYSNPPAHGGEVVATILRDPELRKQWEVEVTTMRNRINDMRHALVEALAAQGVPGDYSFMTRQRGMFSFSGLTKEQVETLRSEYAIYIVGSGRINVAGLTPANVERVAQCIGEVVGQPAGK
jgi:aspartate/tyrosine/aromatic aminotransferase